MNHLVILYVLVGTDASVVTLSKVGVEEVLLTLETKEEYNLLTLNPFNVGLLSKLIKVFKIFIQKLYIYNQREYNIYIKDVQLRINSKRPPICLFKASLCVIKPEEVLSIIVEAPIEVDKIRKALQEIV